MDFDNLKKSVANLSLYDIKAGVRQLQNAVMNYTEMEAKVREATNNEPWGASSTIMQDIANGTFNYQLLNEIMPMIYHRFTEKSADQWRQIYKALQLLEFLIKNGSERVIDDARAHLSLLKMLKQFHFIDQNGKDQGINVRNRSKELTDLLSDVEKIRTERKKAKQNRAKYGGYEGGGGGISSSSSGGGGRFGGFGSESGGAGPHAAYGAYDGRVYGDGGGFGGEAEGTYSETTQDKRDKFEEYDEYEETGASSARRKPQGPSSPTSKRQGKKVEAPKPKEPEVDLFDFGDEPITTTTTSKLPASSAFGALSAPAPADDDDDFDDFQSAPSAPAPVSSNAFSIPAPISSTTTTSSTQFAAPKPQSGTQGQSINDLFSSISPPPSTGNNSMASSGILPIKSIQPTNYQPAQPNYFTSVPLVSGSSAPTPSARPAVSTTPGGLGKPIGGGAAKKPAGDAFAGLLSGMGKKDSSGPAQNKTMADLARQKASAGIWGSGPSGSSGAAAKAPARQGQQQKLGNGLDDLLG